MNVLNAYMSLRLQEAPCKVAERVRELKNCLWQSSHSGDFFCYGPRHGYLLVTNVEITMFR